ncbi:MAG: hypothetical protein CVV07_01045 [Gammaproteobacteria bacterium HGW-Gammaproteobacteria-11]|nr:MAG: hypothetical protein CVV07_01045 [Gammaproteobacteria bacterium HGW-Gammaproteobacteria-11]
MDRKCPFFHAACVRSHKSGQSSSGGPRWGDVYAVLIAAEHSPAEIGRYTHRQVLLHYDRALANERRQRYNNIMDMNMAFAGGTNAADYLNKLL